MTVNGVFSSWDASATNCSCCSHACSTGFTVKRASHKLIKKNARKLSIPLTAEETQAIIDGNIAWMADSDRPLVQELYSKMRSSGLRPKTIVDYTREPFIYAPGNVRVTLDYNIRTGMNCTEFLSPTRVSIPTGASPIILEVKWDEFLPSIIQSAVQLDSRHATAFSKYAACRMYG